MISARIAACLFSFFHHQHSYKNIHAPDLHGVLATCSLTPCGLVLPQPSPSIDDPVVHLQSCNPLIFSQSSHPFFLLLLKYS